MMTNIPTASLLSGRTISKLGLGTWYIGGPGAKWDPDNDDVGQIRGLKEAIDSGFNLIRTAHNYAEGHCE